MKPKLSPADKHLMRLIRKDKKPDGYTSCSAAVFPFVAKLPEELVETIEVGTGGIARLTEKGNTVLDWI